MTTRRGRQTTGDRVRVEEHEIAVADLDIGMYVCRLDRDWEGTPFPLQGMMITGQEDIDALAEWCSSVFVDVLQSEDEPGVRARSAGPGIREYDPGEIESLQHSRASPELAAFEAELPQARVAQARTARLWARILDDVREGRQLSPEHVRDAVAPMVRSVVRNADAFLWIERLRERGSYEYDHALGCSALAAAFGRHLGLPEDLLVDLAGGALLLDIGKLKVPAELLHKPGPLAPAEMRVVREHVAHALELLDAGAGVPAHVREMVATHHERLDGTGYPAGIAGDRIPLLGSIASVIDSYHAMTSKRPYRDALPQHAALQELYRNRDQWYASETVEQFIQCMSVYPVGSLVELTTGEVAVVMAQNAARRLLPRVMVLTTPGKELLEEFRSLDLLAKGDPDPETGVRVAAPLDPGAYGLAPAELFL